YVQHLGPEGLPAEGWSANGMRISSNINGGRGLVADGVGGVVALLAEAQNPEGGVFAQRLTPTGSVAPGWPVGGIPVTQPGCAFRGVTSDGGSGFYLACAVADLSDFADHEFHAHRWAFDAAPAIGWTEQGVPVCTAPGSRYNLRMTGDGF